MSDMAHTINFDGDLEEALEKACSFEVVQSSTYAVCLRCPGVLAVSQIRLIHGNFACSRCLYHAVAGNASRLPLLDEDFIKMAKAFIEDLADEK